MAANYARRVISIRRVLQRSWAFHRHGHSANNDRAKRHRYHVGLWALVLLPGPALAQANATANPVANSTGSVTNQAIQMLTGPYPTNAYGPGISCQGPTLNISPFVTTSKSYALPFTDTVRTPYYDPTDDDENGVPDNPGNILYYQELPSGQKNNHALNFGVSATVSIPLDGGLQERCKASADTHTALQRQLLANKRLDFELSRLRHCGELAQKGISFHPKSKFYVVCSDVVLGPIPGQKPVPHIHRITVSKPDAKRVTPGSGPAEPAAAPTPIPVEPFSP